MQVKNNTKTDNENIVSYTQDPDGNYKGSIYELPLKSLN